MLSKILKKAGSLAYKGAGLDTVSIPSNLTGIKAIDKRLNKAKENAKEKVSSIFKTKKKIEKGISDNIDKKVSETVNDPVNSAAVEALLEIADIKQKGKDKKPLTGKALQQEKKKLMKKAQEDLRDTLSKQVKNASKIKSVKKEISETIENLKQVSEDYKIATPKISEQITSGDIFKLTESNNKLAEEIKKSREKAVDEQDTSIKKVSKMKPSTKTKPVSETAPVKEGGGLLDFIMKMLFNGGIMKYLEGFLGLGALKTFGGSITSWVGKQIMSVGAKLIAPLSKVVDGLKSTMGWLLGKIKYLIGGVMPSMKNLATKGKDIIKTASSSMGKIGGKTLLKSGAKKLPIIGALAGLAFGAQRLMAGDKTGALAELASGVAGSIPFAGTAVSVAIDAGLAARDMKAAEEPKKVSSAGKITHKVPTKGEARAKAKEKLANKPQTGFMAGISQSVSDGLESVKSTAGDALQMAKNLATSSEDVKKALKNAASKVGVPEDLLTRMAYVESRFNPNAGASTSSASGLFQFTKKTWAMMMGTYAKKYGLTGNESVYDPMASALMGAQYVKDNMAAIAPYVSKIGATEIYAAHFLGAGGAKKFFKAYNENPSIAGATIDPVAAKANHNIFYDKNGNPKSVRDIYQHLSNLMGGGAIPVSTTKPSTGGIQMSMQTPSLFGFDPRFKSGSDTKTTVPSGVPKVTPMTGKTAKTAVAPITPVSSTLESDEKTRKSNLDKIIAEAEQIRKDTEKTYVGYKESGVLQQEKYSVLTNKLAKSVEVDSSSEKMAVMRANEILSGKTQSVTETKKESSTVINSSNSKAEKHEIDALFGKNFMTIDTLLA